MTDLSRFIYFFKKKTSEWRFKYFYFANKSFFTWLWEQQSIVCLSCAGFWFWSISASGWMLFDMRPVLPEPLVCSQRRPCQRDVCSYVRSRYQQRGQCTQCHAGVGRRNVLPQPCTTFTPTRVISIQWRRQGSVQRCEKCRKCCSAVGESTEWQHCDSSVNVTLSESSLGKVNSAQLDSRKSKVWMKVSHCTHMKYMGVPVYCWALLIHCCSAHWEPKVVELCWNHLVSQFGVNKVHLFCSML